jgi:hypothetical protein
MSEKTFFKDSVDLRKNSLQGLAGTGRQARFEASGGLSVKTTY